MTELNIESLTLAIERAIALFKNKKERKEVVERIMRIENSWDNSAALYFNMYEDLI